MILKIFERKNYSTMMFILITLVLILLLFSFINIIQDLEKNTSYNKKLKFLTGYTISENLGSNNSIQNKSNQIELYSEQSYVAFYLIIISTITGIFIVLLIILLPRIKPLT